MNVKKLTAFIGFFAMAANSSAYAWGSVKDDIYSAAKRGDINTLNRYMQQGYSIDATDRSGTTALCSAYFDGNSQAYNLLIRYGANPYANCMYATPTSSFKVNPYMVGGAVAVAAGVGIAIAAGGGGGGGGSGGSSSGNTGGDTPGGDTPGGDTPGGDTPGGDTPGGDTPGGDTPGGDTPGGDTPGGDTPDQTAQKIAYFTNSKEYTGANFSKGSVSSVNYLGAIRAAQAYSKFTDVNGNFEKEIKPVTVGIIDNGVWANHAEFYGNNGNKVKGYNYDYGPCQGNDTSYCWAIEDNRILGIKIGSNLVLYGPNANSYIEKYSQISQKVIDDYYQWKSFYPDDYDWNSDKYNSSYFPNDYETSKDKSVMHGTNVAGIIASNKNGYGNMGVAYMNANLIAVRWDMRSSIYNPFARLLTEGAEIVNMSYGTDADSDSNASLINSTDTDEWDDGILRSARLIIENNTVKHGHTDGMILVKAAGNEAYSQPDIQSGLKLYNASFTDSNGKSRQYSEIQMLVVVAVNVNFDANGNVSKYSLSEFSNQCGVTKNYCISAPGGNTWNNYGVSSLYSTGQPGVSLYDDMNIANYVDMAGTSQATPVVSGALAFLKGAYPYLSSSELIDLVLTTANYEKADSYSAEKYGAGLLDLGKATDYVPLENSSIQTYTTNSVNSVPVQLNSSHLNVSSTLKYALKNVLPENITIFDKYNRPFAVPTENYVSATHGSYKNFKNDVNHIAFAGKTKKIRQGNFNLSFNENSASKNYGFIDVEYRGKQHTTGFYFKSNTAYDSEKPFNKDMKNPFMILQSAYGMKDSYKINDNFAFNVEAAIGKNGLYDGDSDFNDSTFKKQAYVLNSELKLFQNKKLSFGLSSGILYEDDAVLGTNGEGAFSVNSSNTYNFGVNASWHVNTKLTLSSGYYIGYTKAQNFETDLIRMSDLISDSFAFDANYATDKQTSFGFMISSPLKVQKGKAFVKFPNGRDNYSDTVYYDDYATKLKTNKREYKFSVYFNKEITEKLSLRAQTDVRINPEHTNQKKDYRTLFGLSWAFN